MPVVPHVRATFSGVFGTATSPVEEWSFGFSLAHNGAADKPDLGAAAAAARAAYVANLAPSMPTRTVLTRVRLASIGETGRVDRAADGSYVQVDDNSTVPGAGSGGGVMPLQTALCVSLMTARPGSTGRGRMFLPWPAFGLGTDYRLTEALAGDFALQVRNLIKASVPAGGDFGGPIVVSSKGFVSSVIGVRVGTVPDTMRSRRERLAEAYQVRPYPG